MYLQCSALTKMGVVVVNWTEFCYVGYVRYSCIKNDFTMKTTTKLIKKNMLAGHQKLDLLNQIKFKWG